MPSVKYMTFCKDNIKRRITFGISSGSDQFDDNIIIKTQAVLPLICRICHFSKWRRAYTEQDRSKSSELFNVLRILRMLRDDKLVWIEPLTKSP